MAKGYSNDLRVRAVALVEEGESRREAARILGLGASTAIRWIERWATTGSVAASPARATVARRSRRIGNGCSILSQRSRT